MATNGTGPAYIQCRTGIPAGMARFIYIYGTAMMLVTDHRNDMPSPEKLLGGLSRCSSLTASRTCSHGNLR